MNKDELAELIAGEIIAQGNEIDNAGDGESICFQGEFPVINLATLAEKILARFHGEL